MEAPRNSETYDAKDGEYCPECGHAWTFAGPAHFTDCRYFSLDDDRDEEALVWLWVTRRDLVIRKFRKAIS